MKAIVTAIVLISACSVTAAQDCNGNLVDDAIDLVTGVSFDCNGNAIPDECDFCSGNITLIDFEGLAESTAIGMQYVSEGVTFGLIGAPTGLPIICLEGDPQVGFTGTAADTPLGGLAGLTDPTGTTRDIEVFFSPPVFDASLFIIDIDGTESVDVRAFDGATLLSSQVFTAANVETGDGVATLIVIQQTNITHIEIDVSDGAGFAVDNLIFHRSATMPGCDRFVRVSQESAPGVGDFDANVLGFVELLPASSSAATQYSYDFPEASSYNGLLLPQIADRSNLAFVETSDHGLCLFVFHDRAVPDDVDGGRAEMSFTLSGDGDGALIVVQDDPAPVDPNDVYTGAAGSSQFAGRWGWSPCCTDGFVLGDLDPNWQLIVAFTDVDASASTPTIQGLSDWFIHSGDGQKLQLAFQINRRVRLDTVSGPCPLTLVPSAIDISISTPVPQTLTLAAGALHAGSFYFLLGSVTGTQPGQDLGPVTLPLNFDPYFALTLSMPNSSVLFNQIGILNASGGAKASLVIPPGLPPVLAGFVFHHAYTLLGVPFVSNPAPARLVP